MRCIHQFPETSNKRGLDLISDALPFGRLRASDVKPSLTHVGRADSVHWWRPFLPFIGFVGRRTEW